MRRAVLVPCLLATVLAGCGASSTTHNAKDFSGDKKAVAQAIDDFAKAARDSDEGKICSSMLAQALVRRLDATTQRCTGAIADQLDAAGDSKIDVKAIAVTGDRATATVVSKVTGHDRTQRLVLAREDGKWRMAGVGS